MKKSQDARIYYSRNSEARKEYSRKWKKEHPDKVKEYSKRYRDNNLQRRVLKKAKQRAKKFGLEFNLEESDIIIPEYCPVLEIPLKFAEGYPQRFSPSCDRVDNSKGYVKGNIRIISHYANRCKSDLTYRNIERLYLYMKGEL